MCGEQIGHPRKGKIGAGGRDEAFKFYETFKPQADGNSCVEPDRPCAAWAQEPMGTILG